MDERFELWAKEDEYDYWRCPEGTLEELAEQRDTLLATLKMSTQFVAKWTADHESVIGQRALSKIETTIRLCQEQP